MRCDHVADSPHGQPPVLHACMWCRYGLVFYCAILPTLLRAPFLDRSLACVAICCQDRHGPINSVCTYAANSVSMPCRRARAKVYRKRPVYSRCTGTCCNWQCSVYNKKQVWRANARVLQSSSEHTRECCQGPAWSKPGQLAQRTPPIAQWLTDFLAQTLYTLPRNKTRRALPSQVKSHSSGSRRKTHRCARQSEYCIAA